MFKYPIYKQDDEISCGAYCLKMIMQYHKQTIEISNIKKYCRLSDNGITIYGMLECLKHYNVEAKSYQCSLDQLMENIKTPCIVLTSNDNMAHYVVLYRFFKDRVIIGDPGYGLKIMYVDEFEKIYTNIMIKIIHIGHPVNDDTPVLTFNNFLIKYLKDNLWDILNISKFSIIIALLSIISSYYFRMLLDEFYQDSFLLIMIYSGIFLFVLVFKELFTYKKQEFLIKVRRILDETYIIKTLKNAVYLPLEFYSNKNGIFITRIQALNDFSDFLCNYFQVIFVDGILMISVMLVLLIINSYVFLFSLILMIVVVSIMIIFYERIKSLNYNIMEKKEDTNEGIMELYNNGLNSKQFSSLQFIKNKIHYIYFQYFELVYQKDHRLNIINGLINGTLSVGILLIVVISLYFYKQDSISIGDVMLNYMLVSYLIDPIMRLISIVLYHDEIQVIFDRYKQLIPERLNKKKKISKIKSISFEHISYSYGYNKPLFEGVDLLLDKSTIISGDIGSGKTTLLKLIRGYDEVVRGRILINSISIKDIDTRVLMKRITYLDKTPVFYNESLSFNMLVDKHSKKKMLELMRYFQLDDLIELLDQKIDSKGGFLSSGQGQLVMLIRALLKNSDVLILDEAFSNVDDTRKQLIFAYLDKIKDDHLCLIVDHQIKLFNENYDCVIIETDSRVRKINEH